MKIYSAAFVKSAAQTVHYPEMPFPEIAFAGRSNVGKSSLINTLLNRKRLVKTSSTPGRTQLINFFLVNDAFSLVDLPGYGYAKVPASVKKKWGPMIETYLRNRTQLMGVVLIVDMRRDPGPDETRFIDWLHLYGISVIPVVTKADKLSRQKRHQRMSKIAPFFQHTDCLPIPFSAKSRIGREAVWEHIERLLPPAPEESS